MLSNQQFKKLLQNSKLKKPFLVGRAGEGKSQFYKDYCQGENLSIFILNCATLESQDFQGLPIVDKDGNTSYARPHFFNYDFLFFDELDRVQDATVKAGLHSLLIDGKINGHIYNGFIGAAGNGTNGNYDTVELDDSLKDRFIFIPFSYTVAQKIAYLEKIHAMNNFLRYVKTKPSVFDEYSTRTLDYCNNFHDDYKILKLVLDQGQVNHYESFVNGLLITFDDLCSMPSKELKQKISQLTSMTKISLSLDVSSQLEKIETLGPAPIENINYFINELDAEEKSNYFLSLKNKVIAEGEKTHVLFRKLQTKGFFKDQKEFLSELQK